MLVTDVCLLCLFPIMTVVLQQEVRALSEMKVNVAEAATSAKIVALILIF